MPAELSLPSHELIPGWAVEKMAQLRVHSPVTHEHSVRVGFAAYLLWESLFPDPSPFRTITASDMFLAGLLHDINKKDIPTAMFEKRGGFTPEEATVLGNHPFAGADEVAEYDVKVADIIRGHHRWGKNGNKYPPYDENPGAQEAKQREGYYGIELAQRILAIADKTDVAINRNHGIHGIEIDVEREEMQSRFSMELQEGIVDGAWINQALQIAWDIGEEQAKWKDF